MKIALLAVPYHYSFIDERVGAGLGPVRYLEAGADERLRQQGYDVRGETVARTGPAGDELEAVAGAGSEVARQVSAAAAAGYGPLVLGGGCSTCLGVLAGLEPDTGIIWFDAHGDFNTPETTLTGFFDGMPLAIATGLCYQELRASINPHPPVLTAHTLLVGVRDLDPGEGDNLAQSDAQVVSAAELKEKGISAALLPALEALKTRVRQVYLHFDIDVLDPAIAPGVDFRTANGLSLDEAVQAIQLVAAHFRVSAAALTAYNPDHEEGDKTLQAGLRIVETMAAALVG